MKIVFVLLLICIISPLESTKLKRIKNQSGWFLNKIFQWLKCNVIVKEDGTGKTAQFSAELNANERGIYLANVSNFPTKDSILNSLAYPLNVSGKDTQIFDFALMTCNFVEKSTSIFSGYNFAFPIRNFLNLPRINYQFEIQFKWGAGFLGDKDPKVMINDFKVMCNNRQQQLKKEKEDREREEARRRIEAEELKKAEEEAKRKAELESKAKAEAERKRIEEEEIKKAEEEARKKAEQRIAQENAQKIIDAQKIAEDKPENKKVVVVDEKKELEIANTIISNIDVGFGNALYITGESPQLGAWKVAYKMSPVKANQWQYKSVNLIEGKQFKTIKYNWIQGDQINVSTITDPKLKWENTQGAVGNKTFKFIDNVMSYVPAFDKRRTRRNAN